MGFFSFLFKSKPTEEDKKNFQKNLNSALSFYEKKEFSQAIKLLEKVILVDDSIAVAHGKLGGAYLNIGKIKKAKKHLEIAYNLNSKLPDVINNLGVLSISLNDTESAISYFEKAIELDDKDPLPLRNLGMCYMQTNLKKFYRNIKKASELGDDEATQILEFMKKTEKDAISKIYNNNEEKNLLLFFNELQYLFFDNKYTEIVEKIEKSFDENEGKEHKFDILILYVRSLKNLKEYNKALHFTHNILSSLDKSQDINNFQPFYIMAGIVHCHLGLNKEALNLIGIGFQINMDAARKFILEEDDELVTISKESGYPSIKLPENYKDILYKDAKKDQLDRKQRIEKILEKNKIRVNEDLPLTISEENVNFRTLEEICQRILAIITIAFKAEGSPEAFEIFKKKFKPEKYFTQKENYFLELKKTSTIINSQFTWKYECVYIFLWSLGYIKELGEPTKPCSAEKLVEIVMSFENIDDFISKSKLKEKAEILDKIDLIYRYDWACVHKKVDNKTEIDNLNAEVVFEWHFAFNWLTRFDNEDWDNVTTPT